MATINERIKERRLKMGLTLAEVADALGVKEATAQRYESGAIKSISHDIVCRLSELFNCSPSYLMGWEDAPTPAATDGILSEEALIVARAYDDADSVDKEMVRRILKIEEKETAASAG